MDYKYCFIFETFNYKNADIHYKQSLWVSEYELFDCIMNMIWSIDTLS